MQLLTIEALPFLISTHMKKIILLNAGTRTRRSFASGLTHLPLEQYKTKELILHIRGHKDITILHKGEAISFEESYVFTRLRATDSLFCGILYEHLRDIGVKASDPINLSFRMSEEKIAQMARLARAGIPVPQTIIAREESYMANKDYILSQLQFPLVYKTDGSQGRNVHKIDTQEELEAVIAQKKPTELFLLQSLIPNTFDTRTLVAYGKVLGTIRRTAKEGVFLNNVSQGASVDAYTLTGEEIAIAVSATLVNNIDFGGVDIIHTTEGPLVLEVNKSPQINGFEKVYGKDCVFRHIAEVIEADEV